MRLPFVPLHDCSPHVDKKQRAMAKEPALTEQAIPAIVNSPLFKEHLGHRRAEIIQTLLPFVCSVGEVGVDGDDITGGRHIGDNENIIGISGL